MKNVIYLIAAFAALSCTSPKKNVPLDFDFGKTENGKYTNNYFNMEVTFNPDWKVQNKSQMNDLIDAGEDLVAGEDKKMKAVIKASQVNAAYLLTVFENEAGAAVDYNPSFMIIAENTKNLPGIKNGKDYLFHARKILEQSQMEYTFEEELSEKIIGEHTFYVMKANISYLGIQITQDYITTVTKGFSLSFVASYSSEEQKAELYKVLSNMKM